MSLVHYLVIAAAVLGPAFRATIRVDAFGDRVSMNAECLSGMRDSFAVSRKCFLNVKFFEFFERFAEHDVAIKHRVNHCLELRSYLHLLERSSGQ